MINGILKGIKVVNGGIWDEIIKELRTLAALMWNDNNTLGLSGGGQNFI